MNFRVVYLVGLILTVGFKSHAQNTSISNPNQLIGSDNAITTAVPFLAITPDARHAALGDAGVASSADGNAAYWNPAKTVFIDKKMGFSLSYTPWLGKIINDMHIIYASGFYKITREQAVNVAIKYFDLGDITFNSGPNAWDIIGEFNPREFSFDGTYSRLLTENLSVGLTGRYIFSNLTGHLAGNDAKAGHSAAADIGVYYEADIKKSARNSKLSLGASISNIGAKISYTNAENKNFLPTNLRLGSAFKTELDIHNSLTFLLDFNKLLVPTPPDNNPSLLSGMFGSFGDAPNGAKEEFQEVMLSTGIEYWYGQTFAGRIGYFHEAENKGNRKYMTVGVGFRKDRFGFDIAYIVPTNKREHPLAETVRFSLMFHIPESTLDKSESVTD